MIERHTVVMYTLDVLGVLGMLDVRESANTIIMNGHYGGLGIAPAANEDAPFGFSYQTALLPLPGPFSVLQSSEYRAREAQVEVEVEVEVKATLLLTRYFVHA
jgi:hypothetical protein